MLKTINNTINQQEHENYQLKKMMHTETKVESQMNINQ